MQIVNHGFILGNITIYYMATRKWNFEEVQGFKEWDQKRKEGVLGQPVRFETVSELESWLHAHK